MLLLFSNIYLEKVKSLAIIAAQKLKSVRKQILSIIFREILTNAKSVKLENQDSNEQEDKKETTKAKLDLIFEVTF